jgi:hypothetical protein
VTPIKAVRARNARTKTKTIPRRRADAGAIEGILSVLAIY